MIGETSNIKLSDLSEPIRKLIMECFKLTDAVNLYDGVAELYLQVIKDSLRNNKVSLNKLRNLNQTIKSMIEETQKQ